MTGQLLYYRSRLNGEFQPLPVCESGDGAGPKPLLLDLSPGAISNLPGSVRRCEELAGWAVSERLDCVIAKPCGMGPGSVYQGPGEVDVFDAIACLRGAFAVDPDRISLMGGSMGGAATWYMASHYPDAFAAAAPYCGYCDYRLWTKPGGLIMRTQPWEEPSWVARGAAFRPGNLANMGVWITHGAWDIGIGGGVPVQHSRNMSRLLGELGIKHTYVEVPRCGHGCTFESTVRPMLRWLGRQRRQDAPARVRLTAHGLRHNRSHWVAIEQFDSYGQPAQADARRDKSGVTVRTRNVRRLALGPMAGGAVKLTIDGQSLGRVSLARPVVFVQTAGRWRRGRAAGRGQKRPGSSGPIGDVFFHPLRLVAGTAGGAHEKALIQWMAGAIPGYFMQHNGGVHRGIFDGQSNYRIPAVKDADLSDADLAGCNLLLLGTPRSNRLLGRFADKLPLEVGRGRIELAGRTYKGKRLGVCACLPSPANPDRLWVITAGATPEALTDATHLHLQLLPDYLVWDGERMVDYGFFDNNWRIG
ncbi:MAG TPA: prolyl oligopeptidase family serine peptidase [Phycisphaerae bacterium]|nr:prolyl oligopeptidase family serine peptidase [Phycisphaerae bacterium]HUU23372.1 prolyl oligopeptidase family serine peptidase [Phycisphaerae bacterium]